MKPTRKLIIDRFNKRQIAEAVATMFARQEDVLSILTDEQIEEVASILATAEMQRKRNNRENQARTIADERNAQCAA